MIIYYLWLNSRILSKVFLILLWLYTTLLVIYHHAVFSILTSPYIVTWNSRKVHYVIWSSNTKGYRSSFYVCCKTKFPVKHSIVYVLRKRYGKILAKNVRNIEKYDFKYKKAKLDVDFLLTCVEKYIISKFLRFKVANRHLQFSNTYNICLKRLLNQEISNKPKLVRTTKQNLTSMKEIWHHEMCFTDFVHITTNFF